jgi:hypothetical protein
MSDEQEVQRSLGSPFNFVILANARYEGPVRMPKMDPRFDAALSRQFSRTSYSPLVI